MDFRKLISKKRDGGEFTSQEIRDWIQGMIQGEFPAYQLSALLMAILLKGMSFSETVALTREMTREGSRVGRNMGRRRIGKHSTGGVGDKVSFLVAPLVASYGIEVPLMSGRGLGHTGGTIDKLSGIAGIKTNLPPTRVQRQLKEIGFCIFEQSDYFAPADRILYALRDATATVESIPLIVSSILSKKLQENLDGIALNVKYGVGSLMGSVQSAKRLAKTLKRAADALKLNCHIVISAMEQPLGFGVGNNLEILECLDVFNGEVADDLRQVVIHLAQEMIALAWSRKRPPSLQELSRQLICSEVSQIFLAGLRAQGARFRGMPALEPAPRSWDFKAPRRGRVAVMDAKQIGELVVELGGGRTRLGESIDPSVGIYLYKKAGDKVSQGETLARVYYSSPSLKRGFKDRLQRAIPVQSKAPVIPKLIWMKIKKH